MPVEFSVAAYRFGYSMIRGRYAISVEPHFRPVAPLARDDGSFDMAQLIRFAEQP
jgi:hypothetical protein